MLLKTQGGSINWERLGYIQYLKKLQPVEENQTTLILDENVPRQADRPTHYNIVIVGDNTSSVDFGAITGTLKGWYFDGTDWQNNVAISTGLSGTVLTFQTGTQYQAFSDDNYYYLQTNNEYLTRIDKTDYSYQSLISITTADIVALLDTNNDASKHDWDLDTLGIIDCDEGLYPVDYTGTITNATTHIGRKDFPLLPYQEPAVLLDGTNKTVFPQDLSAASISAVYGMKADGTKLVLADLSIDSSGAVGTHFITNPLGDDCHVTRIDIDDGTQAVFLGGIDNDGNRVFDSNMRDCSGNENHATVTVVDEAAALVTQDYYSHKAVYGYGNGRAFNLDVNTVIDRREVNDSLSNHNMSAVYLDVNGEEMYYYAGIQTDGTDTNTSILDPDGENQELTVIDGEFCLNSYADYGDANVSPIAGSSTMFVLSEVGASSIYVEIEIKVGAVSSFGFRDESLAEKFTDEIDSYYGVGAASQITNVATFWNTFNNGSDQGGACPNGVEADSYPATTFGITTGNGYNYDATSTKFREILEGLLTDGSVNTWLEATRTDGFHTSTSGNWEYTLIKKYSEALNWNTVGTHILNKDITTLQPVGSLNMGNTFFSNYERVFEKFQVFLFSITKTGVNWYRFKKFTINEKEIIPGLTDGSNIDSRFGEPNDKPSGKHLCTSIAVQNPNFRAQEQALTTNFDYSRVEGDVRDRVLIELRTEHTDKNFPAFVYKSGSSWDLGTYINSRTITEVLGSANIPSDFTISSNTITAAVDVSFGGLLLDNGDLLYYKGNEELTLHNSNGVNDGTLTTSNVTDNQGTQDTFDWDVEINPTKAVTKAKKYTDND